ncbi:hypothetical protein [Saltatorellus ferox]|uniref:hypothetical protein n=1 Tax=Saltatorellus ferox TaxID=2528018 RepID=UPI003AF3C6AE
MKLQKRLRSDPFEHALDPFPDLAHVLRGPLAGQQGGRILVDDRVDRPTPGHPAPIDEIDLTEPLSQSVRDRSDEPRELRVGRFAGGSKGCQPLHLAAKLCRGRLVGECREPVDDLSVIPELDVPLLARDLSPTGALAVLAEHSHWPASLDFGIQTSSR